MNDRETLVHKEKVKKQKRECWSEEMWSLLQEMKGREDKRKYEAVYSRQVGEWRST